jgi:1,4-alpha-glucan branching enzyme
MAKETTTGQRRKITFSLVAPQAREVYLVGEFNQWRAGVHPMRNEGNGVWRKSLMLPEGKFEYKFLVDSQWLADPANERVCTNCFGTKNSVVSVVKPSPRRM